MFPSGGGNHDESLKHFGDVCFEMQRCEEAKRQSLLQFGLFKKIDKFLSLNFRNFLISPLEGEKKFLGELNELRNFREGYDLKYSCPVQHETVLEPSPAFVMLTGVRKRLLPLTKREGCDSVISSDFKSKISITNENNLSCKELSALVPQYLSNFSDTVFSRFTSHFSHKRTAFTLAEVLITLGIIGIVASMTLPSLIQSYKERVTSACEMGGDVSIDINGYDKGPNQLGKDVFAFVTAQNGVYPAGLPGSYTAGDCKLSGRGFSCTEYILREKNMKYLKEN